MSVRLVSVEQKFDCKETDCILTPTMHRRIVREVHHNYHRRNLEEAKRKAKHGEGAADEVMLVVGVGDNSGSLRD